MYNSFEQVSVLTSNCALIVYATYEFYKQLIYHVTNQQQLSGTTSTELHIIIMNFMWIR